MVKFRCPGEDYALLQRLRNGVISLKAVIVVWKRNGTAFLRV